jgi:hypothetical protein
MKGEGFFAGIGFLVIIAWIVHWALALLIGVIAFIALIALIIRELSR